MHSRIVGTGSCLPARVLSNVELARSVDTSDAWIQAMTGICARHIAAEGESTTEMAAIAAQRALLAAGMAASDLELIIVATITPDLVFPSTAAMLQARIGARDVGCFDLSAACSGFVFGLSVADGLITSGKCKAALVVGAERMSQLLDWKDRSTCVLFGDGAGAAVLVPSAQPGIRSANMHAEGSSPDVLRAPSKVSPYLHMNGSVVFKFAVRALADAGMEALRVNRMVPDEVDWVIPHQANRRIIEASAKKLHIDMTRVIITVDHHANTSAASIPLAMDEAIGDGRILRGDTVLLLSVGGGFTWGSCMLEW
jgi:3-oxoacyl-[acyl-carrier-protein] synthase-3